MLIPHSDCASDRACDGFAGRGALVGRGLPVHFMKGGPFLIVVGDAQRLHIVLPSGEASREQTCDLSGLKAMHEVVKKSVPYSTYTYC